MMRPQGTPRRVWLLAVAAVLGSGTSACQRGPRSIAPLDLVPISPDSVAQWLADFTPGKRLRYELRWRLENDRGTFGGRAAVRVAPPDSLRFDIRGGFGRSGAAMVVGSEGIWARPESDFKDILQSAPLFWAALGAPLKPPAGAKTFGVRGPDRRAWRYGVGADTFDFVLVRDRPQERLLAEMRRRGQIVGVVEALFPPGGGGKVASARMNFPAADLRFAFSVESLDSATVFPSDVWQRP